MIPTLEWTSEGVRFLDQTRLPLEETYVLATSYQEVANVITTMVVRGAPAIGVSAAMGVALGVNTSAAANIEDLTRDVRQMCQVLAATRPTAVNLFWAISRMEALFDALKEKPGITLNEIRAAMVDEALGEMSARFDALSDTRQHLASGCGSGDHQRAARTSGEQSSARLVPHP